MALRDIGAEFQHHKLVEIDKFAVASYNAIHNTNFPTLDITKMKGEDLGIVNKDRFCYILTWSYPCQSVSLAGKREGMKEGSGTASSLGWEVMRLLKETVEKPDVLLMENVPQVLSGENLKEFQRMQDILDELGYINFVQLLNAKDFGVAQNRLRAFQVSIYGKQYNYRFPQPIPLTKTIADYLEDEVDEKYYINSDRAKQLIETLEKDKQIGGRKTLVDSTLGEPKSREVANCILTRQRGIVNKKQEGNVIVEVIDENKADRQHNETSEEF